MKMPVAMARHGRDQVELVCGPLPQEARRLYEGTWSRQLPEQVMYGMLKEDVTFSAEASLTLFLDKRPGLPAGYYLRLDTLTSHLKFSESEFCGLTVSSLAHVEIYCDTLYTFKAGFILFVCGVIDYAAPTLEPITDVG